MTLHRFFITPNIIENNKVTLPEETSHQITQVLRLKEGEQIIILDNTGLEYLGILTKSDKRHSEIKIIEKRHNKNEPELKVHLYQSLIARDNFELVLQKTVELGVSEITPIQTERTQFGVSWAKEKLDRWNRIIKEAAEQSERGVLPKLNEPLNFESVIKHATGIGQTLIAWEKEPLTTSLRGVTTTKQSQSTSDSVINIFIGPEGGFTEDEIEYAKEQGIKTISLGKRILRAETASIALLVLLLSNQ